MKQELCSLCEGTGKISRLTEVYVKEGDYWDVAYELVDCDCIKNSNVIIGYMDKVDFDCESGQNPSGNEFFPTVEDVLRERTCSEFCGVVEVEIRLRRVVQGEKDE